MKRMFAMSLILVLAALLSAPVQAQVQSQKITKPEQASNRDVQVQHELTARERQDRIDHELDAVRHADVAADGHNAALSLSRQIDVYGYGLLRER